MQLPNSEVAYVPKEKLTGYLLSEIHPVGRAKSRYFRSLGYHEGNADELEASLIAIAQNQPVTENVSTPYGENMSSTDRSCRRTGGLLYCEPCGSLTPATADPGLSLRFRCSRNKLR